MAEMSECTSTVCADKGDIASSIPNNPINIFQFIDLQYLYYYLPNVSFTLAKRFGMSRCCGHFSRHLPQPMHDEAGSPRCTGDIETV